MSRLFPWKRQGVGGYAPPLSSPRLALGTDGRAMLCNIRVARITPLPFGKSFILCGV